jgi:hypothetical protein
VFAALILLLLVIGSDDSRVAHPVRATRLVLLLAPLLTGTARRVGRASCVGAGRR